jgi:acyl carrier protein phosphodiesterase
VWTFLILVSYVQLHRCLDVLVATLQEVEKTRQAFGKQQRTCRLEIHKQASKDLYTMEDEALVSDTELVALVEMAGKDMDRIQCPQRSFRRENIIEWDVL